MAPVTPIACETDPAGRVRLALAGRVTVAEAGRLHRVALDLAAGTGDVTVCCDAVEYLDGAAIQVVLAMGRDLARRGRRCEVTGVTGRLADLFRVAGLG